MSKQETVEVTVKVPKHIMDFLEDLEYFGWSKEQFFMVAVQGCISAEMGELDFRIETKLKEKYGSDIGLVPYKTLKALT